MPLKLEKWAPALFVFLWSTGFIGARYIVPYAEPFTFLTIRYVIAAAILLAIAAALKQPMKLDRAQIKASVAVGLMLHVIYIGGVFYAVSLGVSAGISAVIVSIQPVLVSVLAVPLLGERLRWVQVVGLLLGVAGIALLLLPKVFQGDYSATTSVTGIVICVVALAIMHQLKSTFALMLSPGVFWKFVLAAGFISANWLAYIWAVNNEQIVEASLGYYMQPILLVLLGIFAFKEELRKIQWVAFIVAAIGVII